VTRAAQGKFEGKVAFITGAARGQGRSHAIRLAQQGADIVAFDICAQIDTVSYAMSTPQDLEETRRLVEGVGGRLIPVIGDVRDANALAAAVEVAMTDFGRIDIVSANAGIASMMPATDLDDKAWQDVIDINLGGVWKTVKATAPAMIAAGNGGSVILTSSFCGVRGVPNTVHYTAAKHGVLGAMKTLANELGRHGIRVNAVAPGMVWTPMIDNPAYFELFCPEVVDPTKEDLDPVARSLVALDVPWLEPEDITNAVLWLASDEARYITGVCISVDAGWANK
jgi:SDR family mycofactocin-dependent oxidoreductase